jgi:hypothetical protein
MSEETNTAPGFIATAETIVTPGFTATEETIVNTQRINNWKWKEFGQGAALVVSASREDAEINTPIQAVSVQIYGSGPYGGERKPIGFYLNVSDVSALSEMFADVAKTMRSD